MAVKSEFYDAVCVIAAGPELTGDDAGAARSLVESAADERQVVDVIVDLEQTHFVDSEGLELLLWVRRRCEELFGRAKLVNVADPVRKILEVTRLDHRLECPGDLAAGLKSMR